MLYIPENKKVDEPAFSTFEDKFSLVRPVFIIALGFIEDVLEGVDLAVEAFDVATVLLLERVLDAGPALRTGNFDGLEYSTSSASRAFLN